MNRSALRRRHSQGFSLIEAMISLVVLSIGILGIMRMQVVASSQNVFGSRQTLAGLIGRDVVDMVERLPWDHPALAVGEHDFEMNHGETQLPLVGATAAILAADSRETSADTSRYEVTWTVEDVAGPDGVVNGRAVLIDVTFTVPMLGEKVERFVTYRFNPSQMVGGASTFPEI